MTGKSKKATGTGHITQALEEFNLTKAQLSNALGMNQGAVSHWLDVGEAPAWTTLAIECLRRRNKLVQEDQVIVCRVPADKAVVVDSFLNALGITPVNL